MKVIYDEHAPDNKMLPSLVKDTIKSKNMMIDKVFVAEDDANDNNDIFRCL